LTDPSNQELPVIVAGAGPVGCTVALYLTRNGVSVVLLEKEADLPVDLRASTFHPPSLEMLNTLGLAKKMIDRGLVVDRYQYRVRQAAGIGYGGFTYDEKFLVVSTSFPFEEVFGNFSWVNYVADSEEWCLVLRTDKIWRVLFPTFPERSDDDQYLLSDRHVQERLHHLYDKSGDYDIGHRTLYNVHQRVSETYIQQRVALAGDACHINNPLGGMGMNGGIHDAYLLAEKLVAILRDGEDWPTHFQHYDRQRRELAVEFVQKHTIENKKLMESSDPDIQHKRQCWLMKTAADPVKARAFMRERAMLDVLQASRQHA